MPETQSETLSAVTRPLVLRGSGFQPRLLCLRRAGAGRGANRAAIARRPARRRFHHQGELRNGSGPVSATCDFEFSLHDALASGAQLGSTQALTATVAAGRFTVLLNGAGQFGARAFDGSARWLAIAVRCPTGVGSFVPLTPRQALTPAPLALALPGLRTEQNAASPNVIGGHISNTVSAGVSGATIGGGGESAFPNTVSGGVGTVSGGVGNTASTGANVGGGQSNSASGDYATVGGGSENDASAAGATVDGGGGRSTGGGYTLEGTAGQPDAGAHTGGGYTLDGGFWATAAAALERLFLPLIRG